MNARMPFAATGLLMWVLVFTADSAALESRRSADRESAADSVAALDSTARLLPLRLRPLDDLAAHGRGRGEVIEPSGVVIDDFGRVFVADASLHRIQRFDKSGGWLGEAGSLGSGPRHLRRPGALALLGTLNVAILDRENRRVQSYDLFGRLQGTLIDLRDETLDRQLGRIDPVAMASDRGGAVYIADTDRDRLLVFDFSGRLIRVLGGYGAELGSFQGLRGVASGPKGELITTEREGARLQRFDPGGRSLGSWPLDVEAGGGALALAADDSTRIAVADEATGTVWVFDTGGRLLAQLGALDQPLALGFAPDGTLLVCEGGAGVVRRYELGSRKDFAPTLQE